ncbi:phosphoribosyltransferase [Clostridium massiliamazoniense]|uniref:phosphoribosyltransferase n=1 Tax=Clostridium massiliamazoniense TaxID=1347366 RepID=UPI0006D817AE|nr:phosphoribosyltransferase [Clostridium massiliamazoniense]
MKKVLILSSEVFTDLTIEKKREFQNFINENIKNGNKIVFTSREASKKAELNEIEFNSNVFFIQRDTLVNMIKEVFKTKDDYYFIVIGTKDHDLYLASTNKLFFVYPNWCKEPQEKAQKYGFKVTNIRGLKLLVDIIENQQSWYFKLELDEKTTVLGLTNAGTYGRHSQEELEMIRAFRAILKDGEKNLYKVLLVHFLAAISSNNEFREIKDWGIMPSSGTELNKDMLDFKEKARILMYGKKEAPIFLRHTKTFKSHDPQNKDKDRIPCDRHFETIQINPAYKGKLKNRVVCIFDDYTTNGTTFETARNLLLKENVKKVFFVSLGKFGNGYYQQDYKITGNTTEKNGYKYELLNRKKRHDFFIEKKAIREIESLHDLIYAKK